MTMSMERLNGRPAIAIAAAGLLLVVLVGWFGFVSPQRQKADDLAVKISETETQLAITEAIAKGSQLAESSKDLAALRVAIPDKTSMPQIIRQLTRAASGGNIRITGITPAGPVPTGAADAIPMNVTVECRYFGIREFLRHLRSQTGLDGEEIRATGRLFAVDSIQFTGGSETNGQINATISISAFAFRTPPATPGATATVPSETPAEAVGG